MSVKDRKKWGPILAKWTPFFIITCTFIGAVLGSFLGYFFQGEFPYEVLTGGLVATIILTVIEVVKQKRKKIIYLKQMNESFTMFSVSLHMYHIFS